MLEFTVTSDVGWSGEHLSEERFERKIINKESLFPPQNYSYH